jgi:hypothetical protein
MWIYFLSLLLAAGMTLALLPACGGSGSGETCNSELGENEGEGVEESCEDEEVDEEELAVLDEELHELREDTGEPSSEEVFGHAEEDAFELSEEQCCV